ncbi:MAG: hypothetical protein ACT4NY_14310 [Pseudonocardiales bacterium]
MPDTDDTRRAQDAAANAAQVLTGLAELLRRDDPQMPDPEQRAGKAALFDRVANDLLAAQGLDNQCLQAADEWTANLSFLLGIHRRQQG